MEHAINLLEKELLLIKDNLSELNMEYLEYGSSVSDELKQMTLKLIEVENALDILHKNS